MNSIVQSPSPRLSPYYDQDGITIYHGDCRDILPLDADVMVTDPPYGIEYTTGRGGKFLHARVVSDGDTSVRDAVLAQWDGPAIVFGSWKVSPPVLTKAVLTWDKGDHVGMGDLTMPWKPNTEEIYILGSGFTGHRGSSVLSINAPSPNFTPNGKRLHPTEKPVTLMQALISKCPPGVILDPFMGSGTTLRAAKDLGRRAIGIELEEKYCEIAVRRLQQSVLPLEVGR